MILNLTQNHLFALPCHKSKKKGKSNCIDSSIDKSIDAVNSALTNLCTVAGQDMFDNFGTMIASQLRSIPVEDALELHTDITKMINNKLLQIHRAKSNSSSSRPSTSTTSHDDFTN